jgi:uncharacterized protein
MADSDFNQKRRTPGVYVTELAAFPPSIVGVPTAVPAFIGYTADARINGKEVFLTPVPISSLADYHAVFGGDVPKKFQVALNPTGAAAVIDLVMDGIKYGLTEQTGTDDNLVGYLYKSLKLFYRTGGGSCFVVSVSKYKQSAVAKDLQDGLVAVADQVGPTMLAVPDASLLDDAGSQAVAQAMLDQCGKKQDRVALLDVFTVKNLKQEDIAIASNLDGPITAFRMAVGENHLSYGMAYFPYLKTTVVDPSDLNYTNFDNPTLVTALGALTVADPRKQYVDVLTAAGKAPLAADKETALDQHLTNAFPLLKQLYAAAAARLSVLPPCGAIAGVMTFTDTTRGVWNAPADVVVNSVSGPTLRITDLQQGDLNRPLDGKAINAIRDFAGRGPVVSGARTLDGNSNDWRYVQVRRTLIYIEQSIKIALNQFVFAANDGQTWVSVTAMISNLLQSVWARGGLMGATAKEAFSVDCGLGNTMTGMDILNGYMVVEVVLQMVHPAEFIELTFKQKMERVG